MRRKWWAACAAGMMVLAAEAGQTQAQLAGPATPPAGVGPIGPAPGAAAVAAGAPGAAAAKPGLFQRICMGLDECRRKICKTPAGQLLNNMTRPASALTGGVIPGFCPLMPSEKDLLQPGVAGAASAAQKDALEAKARRDAVRFLGTLDCRYYPDAAVALAAALRTDGSECVRFEAALVLGRGCCCTQKTLDALEASVSGMEIDGNPAERSIRVRCAAAIALERCLACYTPPALAPLHPPIEPEKLIEPPAKLPEGGVLPVPTPVPVPPGVQSKGGKPAALPPGQRMPSKESVERARKTLAEFNELLSNTAPFLSARPGTPVVGRQSVFQLIADSADGTANPIGTVVQTGAMIPVPTPTPVPVPMPALGVTAPAPVLPVPAPTAALPVARPVAAPAPAAPVLNPTPTAPVLKTIQTPAPVLNPMPAATPAPVLNPTPALTPMPAARPKLVPAEQSAPPAPPVASVRAPAAQLAPPVPAPMPMPTPAAPVTKPVTPAAKLVPPAPATEAVSVPVSVAPTAPKSVAFTPSERPTTPALFPVMPPVIPVKRPIASITDKPVVEAAGGPGKPVVGSASSPAKPLTATVGEPVKPVTPVASSPVKPVVAAASGPGKPAMLPVAVQPVAHAPVQPVVQPASRVEPAAPADAQVCAKQVWSGDTPAARQAAAAKLAAFDARQHPVVVETLLAAAINDPASAVRVDCLRHLAACPSVPEYAYVKVWGLTGDRDPAVSRAAQDAMSKMHRGQ